MQIIRAYIDSIIKSNKIVVFIDDKIETKEETARKLIELKDLLRVYQINEQYILIKQISKLQDSLNSKAYSLLYFG